MIVSGVRCLEDTDFLCHTAEIDQRPNGERKKDRAQEKENGRDRESGNEYRSTRGEAKYNDTSHQASESTRRDLTDFAPR